MFVNDKHSAITLFCSVIKFHVVKEAKEAVAFVVFPLPSPSSELKVPTI